MVGDFEIARSVSEIIEAVAITAISFAVVLAVAVGIVEMVRWEWNTAFQRFKRYTALGLLVGSTFSLQPASSRPSSGSHSRKRAHTQAIGTDPHVPELELGPGSGGEMAWQSGGQATSSGK